MNKPVLSKEQLTDLRHFIYSRGFRDALVQQEILDHFACKVEEKMRDEPNLNLATAMREAHYEFGYNGFYNIASAMEAGIEKKYRAIYWREVRSILLSPVLLLLALSGYAAYSGYMWAHTHSYFMYNENLFSIGLFVFIVGLDIIRLIHFKASGENFYRKYARPVFSSLPWWLPLIADAHNDTQALVQAILCGIIVAVAFINYIARYKQLSATVKDNHEFRSLTNEQSLL